MTFDSPLFSTGLSYYRRGSGEQILLIHGVGMCAESWYQQFEFLSQSFDVIAIDLSGHGSSDFISVDSPTVGDYANVVAGFIKRELDDNLHIVGHSLGALIAIDLACHHGHICRSIVALSTIYQRSKTAITAVQERAAALTMNKTNDVSSTPLRRWFTDSAAENYAEYTNHCARWLNDANTKQYAAAYHAFAFATDYPDTLLQKIACPTLYLTGELDPNSTPEMSKALAKITPQGQAMIVADARHMLQLTHPSQVNQSIADFTHKQSTTAKRVSK